MTTGKPTRGFWLFAYARAVCSEMSLDGLKTKGKGHLPRREVRSHDPFESLLPHFYVHPPEGRPAKGKRGSMQFGNLRVALECHYHRLSCALFACGYDLDRSRCLSHEAYRVANVWWALHREPMPAPLEALQFEAVRSLLNRRDQTETRRLARLLRS